MLIFDLLSFKVLLWLEFWFFFHLISYLEMSIFSFIVFISSNHFLMASWEIFLTIIFKIFFLYFWKNWTVLSIYSDYFLVENMTWVFFRAQWWSIYIFVCLREIKIESDLFKNIIWRLGSQIYSSFQNVISVHVYSYVS